ncbi:MAG: hypothetical protein ACJ8EZ_10310 [Sphingomicrobium sp.]
MRSLSLLRIGAAIVGCTTTAAQEPFRSAAKQRQFEQLLAGKVAGPPLSCLPTYRQDDMVIIDERTIAFRQGSGRTYINHMQGGCSNLSDNYTLVTKQFGSAQLCRGDIAQVVDLTNHFTVGSCVFGDFVPYVRPRA